MLSQIDARPSKTGSLDLSFLTTSSGEAGASSDRIAQPTHNDGVVLDDRILDDPEVQKCIANEGTFTKKAEIINIDRAACARVAGQIAKKYGDSGFAGSLTLDLEGSSGQSFGAFVVGGMNVRLVGEANDYVAKSMSGGEIAIMPPPDSPFAPESASIAGNACLYGATGCQVFISGRAG